MGKILDINDLYLMRAISDEPSLSAVAGRLNITRSAVTKRVQKIESIIGKPLIKPTGSLQLTESGELFLELSKYTLNKYDEFLKKIGNIKTGQNLIRVMGNPMVMSFDMPLVAGKLKQLYPDVELDIFSGSAEETIKSLIAGDIDLGFVPDNPNIMGLIFYRYKKEKICVLANKSHPLSTEPELTLSAIATARLVGTGKSRAISSIVNSAAKRVNITLDYISHTDDYYLQAAMIAGSNLGIGITYEQIASKWEAMADVVKIPISEPWAVRNFFIVTQKHEHQQKQIASLINIILESSLK